jgi:hypothetical protein
MIIAASTTIRAASESDFHEWLPLWDGYNAVYSRDA